jgi:uncharacterized protein YcfJ
MSISPSISRGWSFQKIACVGTAVAMAGLSGCSSVAPSRTASGAGTGAAVGGVGGAVVGNNSSIGSGAGIVGGAVLGAAVGGIIGMVQDAKDRKEQDRLSQERAYQQELAKKRSEEARAKSEMDEELAIAQGFRISDLELGDAQKKLELANDRLKKLKDERSGALAKKKALDDAHDKTLSTEAEIARIEEELSRLKGDEGVARRSTEAAMEKKADNTAATGAAAAKPGI